MKYDQQYVSILKERIEIIEKRERDLHKEYTRMRWLFVIAAQIAAAEFILLNI